MSAKPKQSAELVLGAEPRADLLPPEVALRAKAYGTRRLLVLLVVLAAVVVGGAVTASYFYAADAQAKLAAAQQRTQDLLAEQIQYSEATRLAGLVDATELARSLGTSTEIVWADVVEQVAAKLPERAILIAITAQSRTPWEQDLAPGGPLRQPRVATLNLFIFSETILDGTNLVRQLGTIEGFADASPDIVQTNENGVSTTITFNIDADALANRFPVGGEESK